MNKIINHLRSGEKVRVFLVDQPPKEFTIFCVADDEIVLVEPFKVLARHSKFPGDTLTVANTIKAPDGTKISIGNQVSLIAPNGKKLKMFVSYLFGKDGLVLSFKKKPSRNSLKWLLKMMSHF